AGEVAGDSREVERRYGEDEALEWSVLEAVPGARRRVRLLLVDARHELDVEAEEVGQFARGVDFGLVGRLRLAEHRRGVQGRAPGSCEELGGTKEDRCALFPWQPRPVVARLACGGDRLLDLRRPARVDIGEDVAFAVGLDRLEGLLRGYVLATDHERDLDPFALELAQPLLQLRALGRARGVVLDGLV